MSFPRSKEARVNKAGRMETLHTLAGNPKLIMHEGIEGAILAAGDVSELGGCPPTGIWRKLKRRQHARLSIQRRTPRNWSASPMGLGLS